MKNPAFLFYSSDWLSGCQFMSMQERGEYITLIAAQHQNGHLDVKRVGFLLGYGWDMVSDIVKSKFKFDNHGLLYNERLDEEIEKRKAFTEKQRLNGQKGGRPSKEETQTETQLKPKRKPKNNPSDNGNDNEDIIAIEEDKKAWFEIFWNAYGKKQDGKKCLEKWMKLSIDEINAALDKVDAYVASTPDVTYRKNPLTWLNGKCWNDEIIKPTTSAKATNFDKALNTDLHGMLIFDK
jgi:uncharacterized protein YdaU (DUF1376 family)